MSRREIAASPETTPRSVLEDATLASSRESTQVNMDVVGARVCQVIAPVTICALYTCAIIRVLSRDLMAHELNLLDKTWQRLGVTTAKQSPADLATNLATDLVIVLAFLTLIILATLLIMLVFYLELHSCLAYYFYLPSLVILTLLSPAILKEVLQTLNWFALDLITTILFVWNFASLGMMSIFGIYAKTPLGLQQFYLIHNSAMLVVLIILVLPGWAPWLLLGFLVLWDLFAVLTPFGPLKLIIRMAEREGIVDMPGLVYSTDIAAVESPADNAIALAEATTTTKNTQATKNDAAKRLQANPIGPRTSNGAQFKTIEPRKGALTLSKIETIESDAMPKVAVATIKDTKREQARQQIRKLRSRMQERPFEMEPSSLEERGVSIGLGDFIFYSLLVGLTARGRDTEDFYALIATLDAILVGLIVTLLILALTRRALPALPISIGLGMYIAGLSFYFAPNLSNRLAEEALFI